MVSNPDEQHTILLALVAFIERDGLFPDRARFMVEHQARVAAFDALEKERILLRWQERTVWTVAGLKVVAERAPFAAQALERGRALFDEMKSMFSVELDKTHALDDLRARLGWDVNEVRRTMMLMYSFPIFHGFSVLMSGHEEKFGMTDGVLRLDAAVFDWAPAGAAEPDESLPEMDEQQLARSARELFLTWFAKPYRQGQAGPVGPRNGTQAERRLALLRYDYLLRRGLVVRSGHQHFRISTLGEDLAFREQALDEALEIHPARDTNSKPFDPTTIRLLAKSIFDEHFRGLDRSVNVIPQEDDDRAALKELTRKGLATESRAGGAFLIGPRGIEVCMGEANLDQILGLAPAPAPPVTAAPTIVNNFHAPIGAVAAAPGAAAHGTVIVHQVDDAMRRVVERQDELGELVDVLLPLLRLARKQRPLTSGEELAAAVTEAEEFTSFQRAVKPGLSGAAVTAATTILELVPMLKPALELLGR